ncbi:MAG: hypothetical protein K2X01_02810 [Cyanobacteria bacterium]|nr:hypothetical protein [Cyanobacteriota bacterium]
MSQVNQSFTHPVTSPQFSAYTAKLGKANKVTILGDTPKDSFTLRMPKGVKAQEVVHLMNNPLMAAKLGFSPENAKSILELILKYGHPVLEFLGLLVGLLDKVLPKHAVAA